VARRRKAEQEGRR